MLKIASIDRWLSICWKPTLELDLIFTEMKPDMVSTVHIFMGHQQVPMG